MAYVGGLYTGASQAAAAEGQRFREFQTNIDEMAARERAAALRQQQAAMDRQMAGLVQPGQLYTRKVLPGVAPKPAQFPTGTAVPEQTVAPGLTMPAGAVAPAPSAGLTPSRMSPGPIEANGAAPLPSEGGVYTTDPNASVIGNVAGEYGAGQRAIMEYNRLRGSLMTNVFGDVGSWFGSQADYDKRQQMKERNSEALQWYESDAVKGFMTSNPAAIAEAQQDPVGYYQKNKNKLGREAAAPTAEPTLGQVQPIPEPDTTGMGITNVSAPLEVPAAVPVKDEAFAAQSAVKLENEFLPRAAEVPQMMTTDTVKQLVQRATEFGVDPAAAVALYGVETNFGRRVGVSEKGAFGVMQVTPATFTGMKKFFTDPAEIKKYNIPQALVSAAANMSPDDANSFDAGLLRMKYAEYKGVDKNLLGAGYNASAETIAKLGRPLATGAGITNEDYNKAYIALYNEARNYTGLEANMPMQAFEGAPLRLQELDANEQLEVTNYNNELNVLQTQNQRILDQRNIIAQQISFAQQSGFANQIPALQRQLLELDNLLMDVTQQANQLNTGYQTKFNDFNMQRTREFGNIAVGRMLGGDPAPLSEMWSRAYGQPVTVQRRSDGKYNIFIGEEGRRVSPADGLTPDQVATEFRVQFDDAYAAQEAERRQKERDAAVQHDRKLQELMIQQVGDIEVAKINKAPVPGFGKPEPVRYDPSTGLAIEFVSQGEGEYRNQQIRYRSPPQQELKDGILTVDQAIITRERRPGLQ